MPRHKSVHPFTRDGDNKLADGRVAFAYRQRISFYQVSPKAWHCSDVRRPSLPNEHRRKRCRATRIKMPTPGWLLSRRLA